MKKYILIPLVALSFLVLPSFGQVKKLNRKAERATDRLEYEAALGYYDEALKKEPDNYRANLGKGMVLSEFLERYDQAIPYLEKALKASPKDSFLRINNSLGKGYQYVGKYELALDNYKKVYNHSKFMNPENDIFLERRIASCKYALDHTAVAPESEQWIKNIGQPVNTNMPEYGAVVMGNELMFTSKRKDDAKEKRNTWDGKYFESMYKTTFADGKYSDPVRYTFPDKKNDKNNVNHNEAVVSASVDGKTLYIFRDAKIYEVDLTEASQPVSKARKGVNKSNYQNHVSLSPDGNKLYFTSGTKGGDGGTDIFMIEKGLDGGWSKPVALEQTVNTFFDEDAPFISSDGTLYFSSNGLPGYGGFDVYKTHLVDGHWTVPENLGQPINSPGDDIYFTLMPNSADGYYSTSRVGGQGDMDIYTVHYGPAMPDTAKAAPPLVVEYIYPDTSWKNTQEPQLEPETNSESTGATAETGGVKPATVYFESNAAVLTAEALAILDNEISVLKNNASAAITISGYADSRGTAEHNYALSQQRANVVKNYFLKNGIKKARITSVNAFGETMLVNDCKDGAVCSEEEHKANRRVEIKLDESVKVPYIGFKGK